MESVFIYKRYSTPELYNQDDNQQDAVIRKFCEKENYTVKQEFHDICPVSEVFTSQGFLALKKALVDSPAEERTKIVANLDRIARNLLLYLVKETALKKLGVRIIAAQNTPQERKWLRSSKKGHKRRYK